jgi:hypothetical protein
LNISNLLQWDVSTNKEDDYIAVVENNVAAKTDNNDSNEIQRLLQLPNKIERVDLPSGSCKFDISVYSSD